MDWMEIATMAKIKFINAASARRTVEWLHLNYRDLDRLTQNGRLINIDFVNCTFGMSRSDITETYSPRKCTFTWDSDKNLLSFQKPDRAARFIQSRMEKPPLPPNVTLIPAPRSGGRQKSVKIIPVPPMPKSLEATPKEVVMLDQWSHDEASAAWPMISHIGHLPKRTIGRLWAVLYGTEADPSLAVRTKKFLKSAKLADEDLYKVSGVDPLDRYAACSALFRVGSKSNFERFSPEAIRKKTARTKIQMELKAVREKVGQFHQKVVEANKKNAEAKKKAHSCFYCHKQGIPFRMCVHAGEVRRICNGCSKTPKAKLDQHYRIAWRLIERELPIPDAFRAKIIRLEKELEEKKPEQPKFVPPTSAAEVMREHYKREEAALIRRIIAQQVTERKAQIQAEEPVQVQIEDEFPLITRTQCGLCDGDLPKPVESPATRKGVQILPMCGRCVSDMIRHERENWTRNF